MCVGVGVCALVHVNKEKLKSIYSQMKSTTSFKQLRKNRLHKQNKNNKKRNLKKTIAKQHKN